MTPEPAQPAESPEARAIVPVEPTEEMIEAGAKAYNAVPGWEHEAALDAIRCWSAMLAASTARPTERGAVEEEAEAAYRAGWVQSSVDAMSRGSVDDGWRDWWHYRSWVTSQSANPPAGQPLEAERLRAALTAAKQAARYVASGDGAYDPYASHVEAVDAIVDAALQNGGE